MQPIDQVILLLNQGRLDLAESRLNDLLAQNPEDPAVHVVHAYVLLERGKLREAVEEAQLGVALAPDSAWSHYNLGKVYLACEDYPAAEQAASEALRLDAQNADYHELLANLLLLQGQFEQALNCAKEGLRLDPTHVECTNKLGLALAFLGRQEEAFEAFGQSLGSDPENALTHASQGSVRLRQAQYEHALEHFREALRIDPSLVSVQAAIVETLKLRYLVYRIISRCLKATLRFRAAALAGLVAVLISARRIPELMRNLPESIQRIALIVLGVIVTILYASTLVDPLEPVMNSKGAARRPCEASGS